MDGQCPGKIRIAGKPHGIGDQGAILDVVRHGLGLPVVEVLQSVFEVAEEGIGGTQFRNRFGGQKAAHAQLLQRGQRRAHPQRLLPAAANELENLDEEFDLADTSRPELDVVGDIPPAILPIGAGSNAAMALDVYLGEMQEWVEAVDEGRSVEDLLPVNVPPTKEWADDLRGRLDFIDNKILLAEYRDQLGYDPDEVEEENEK